MKIMDQSKASAHYAIEEGRRRRRRRRERRRKKRGGIIQGK
jgi:hypothetical protein